MDQAHGQQVLAQALRAVGGSEEEFLEYWRSLDAATQEYAASSLARSLVAVAGLDGETDADSRDAVVDELAQAASTGSVEAPARRAGRHAATPGE
jgi:hypothetical protein